MATNPAVVELPAGLSSNPIPESPGLTFQFEIDR